MYISLIMFFVDFFCLYVQVKYIRTVYSTKIEVEGTFGEMKEEGKKNKSTHKMKYNVL